MTFLIVTLSVTLPTPLKVNAADDNTNKYLYVIGTIAAYAGIDIDVNAVSQRFPRFVDDIISLADEIYTEYAETYGWTNDTQSGHSGSGSHRDGSDGIIQSADDIQGYLDYLVSALKPYNPISNFVDYRFVFCLIRAIERWVSTNIHTSVSPASDSIYGTVSVSTNFVDFNTARSINFDFPAIQYATECTVDFPLNNCHILFYCFASEYTYQRLKCRTSSSHNPTSMTVVCIYPNNYDFYTYTSFAGVEFSQAHVYNIAADINRVISGVDYPRFMFDGASKSFPILDFNDMYTSSVLVSNGHVYSYARYSNGKYGFYCSDNGGMTYNNLLFDSGFAAVSWIWECCGISLSQGSTYIPMDTTPSPIIIDNTTYDNTVTNITNVVTNNTYQEGDSVEMVFPSYYITNNYYNYDDYRQHPEYIFDFGQDGLLNQDFNMPSYDGNILATKFPFCIPFDIIHLFTNFSAEAEAPELHFVVLPADSFGLGNDEFSIDIDFQDYHVIVQLLRFFIAAGFVLWLMVVTNRVLHH